MHQKTRLVFRGEEVRKLIEDSRQAETRVRPYAGKGKDIPLGLLLVKDDGIYLLSNAVRKGAPAKTGLISYAEGFGPLDKATDRAAHYEKIRDAVGGDDFCEAIPVTASFDTLVGAGVDFIVFVAKDKISYQIRRRGKEAS